MFELGSMQTLYVDHKTDFGVYLCENAEEAGSKDKKPAVLLPRKQVPQGTEIGDPVEVFIYKDSADRLIATSKRPELTLGQVARLRVVQVTKIGAFLYWGLEKDLLLPFSEQIVRVKEGEEYLVGLYVDKSERLCATMKIYDYLSSDSPYKKDDVVKGYVFEKNPEHGVFVAVDGKYLGMIENKEIVRGYRIGQEIEARVVSVREDGKLNLSVREKAYIQMDVDSAKIMKLLKEAGGSMPYYDKSSPDEIKEVFGMSKNEFKRAIGRLYKNRSIVIDKGIRLIDKD